MTTPQFYSPVQGHLHFLQFFAITINFAMNTPVCETFGSHAGVPRDTTRGQMALQYNALLLASTQYEIFSARCPLPIPLEVKLRHLALISISGLLVRLSTFSCFSPLTDPFW